MRAGTERSMERLAWNTVLSKRFVFIFSVFFLSVALGSGWQYLTSALLYVVFIRLNTRFYFMVMFDTAYGIFRAY